MSSAASPTDPPVVAVIEPPGRSSVLPKLSELWHYRDLLYLLTRRDIAIRYKQTAIGAAWAIVQPVGLAIVFSLFLGLIFERDPSGDIPYPVFLLTGLTLWVYLSAALSRGAISTLGASSLIEKVYFPRTLIPLSAIIPPLVDFALAFGVLIVTMLLYGITPTWQIVFAPVVLATAVVFVLGTSFLLSGIVVRYRDVQFAIPFALQLLLFMSAVIYPLSRVPESTELWLALNPLVGLMETFRWSLLADADAPGLLLLIPAGAGILLVVVGLLAFQRAERTFADVI